MMRPIKKGSTDQSVVIRIVDSTDGTPETGVVAATGGLAIEYRRELAASTSIGTIADLAALTTAHADAGIKHIGNGYYRVDLPDAAVATGVNGVIVHATATGMVGIGTYVPLVDYDPYDAVRMGMTALPNAAANATGGLFASVVNAGTAQAGSATGITLAAAAFGADDLANGLAISIISGTGAKQTKQIVDFATATQIATTYVAGPPVQGSAWVTTPDNTSVYVVHPFPITPAAITVTSGAVAITSSTANNLRKNVAVAAYPFKMVDATDKVTPETGITVTVTRSLGGAAFSAVGGVVTEVGAGIYVVNLISGDMNNDSVVLRFAGTGCYTHEHILFPQPT